MGGEGKGWVGKGREGMGGKGIGLEGRGKDGMEPEERYGRGGRGWFPKSPPLKNPRSATETVLLKLNKTLDVQF